MRRVAAAALLLLLGAACASPPPPELPPPPAAFYWETRGPGGGALFLLGSVHVGADGRELAPTLRVELDWARAEELVVEVDLHALPDLERLEAIHRHGLLPPEHTLREVVSPGTWSLLLPYLRAHGQPLAMVSRMRPWLAAQQVAQLEFAAAGTAPENGVDAWFLRRAVAEGKPVAQLETLEEQLALFGALPASVEEALLRDMLEQSAVFRETIHAIRWAWEHGEEARLLDLLLGSRDDPRLEAFHQTVFAARNQRMAARLAALAADGRRRFVVVGTGHLIGPESVPALLAGYGFSVERHPEAFVRTFDPAALPVPAEPAAHP